MPIRWGNSNVFNFEYNSEPAKVSRKLSYKTNLINGKNARGRAPVLQRDNTRRKNLYNPYLNPQAAYTSVAIGINVPRNFTRKLTSENAFKNAAKAHANWLRNNKPEAARNENTWSNSNLSNISRNENMANNKPLPLVLLPKTNIMRETWNQRSRKARNRNSRGDLKVVRNTLFNITPQDAPVM
jgi:hypothetical protein